MSKTFIMPAGNVVIPTYLALLQKGYAVWREGHAADVERWHAENSECHFVADGPEMLLALAALYEVRGKEWKASDAEIESFLAHYYPHTGE